MERISRRKALTGAGVIAGALAISGQALATGGIDAELQALWVEFIKAVSADASARAVEMDAEDRALAEASAKCEEVDAREAEAEAKHTAERIPALVHVDGYDLDKSQLDMLGNLVAIMHGPEQDKYTSEWARKEKQRIRATAKRKYKVASFKPRVHEATSALKDIEQSIMDTRAHGVMGATIKLALSMFLDRDQMQDDTYVNDRGAGASAYRVLCDLTGTDFVAEAFSIEKRAWS